MMPIWSLYRLQQVDSKMARLIAKLSQDDGGAELLRKIQAREQKHEAAAGEQHALKIQLKDAELKLASVEAHRKEVEKQLYSGKTTNPKELAGFSAEVDAIRSQQGKLEDQVLALMEALDQQTEALGALKARLEKGRKALQDHSQQADSQKMGVQHELDELSQKRNALSEEIDPALVARYEALRKRKEGVAVARMDGTCCGECGAGLPDAVRRRVQERALEVCSNCERILFTD